MDNLNKREIVKNILELKETNYIPVMLNVVSLSPALYNYEIPEILMDPEKFAECFMGTREKYGFDGLCAGLNMGVLMDMAGHLPNDEGVITGLGEETLHGVEDLDKLKAYDPEKSILLQNILKTIKIMRKEQPNEPIYVIVENPASNAVRLLGSQRAYRYMAKQPEVFLKVVEAIEGAMYAGVDKLCEAGVDFIWNPMPSLSGFCISKKTYEKCCWDSNKRFNKRIHDNGTKVIIHTCGKYDDRFDLVLQEYGDAWHLANTETKKVKEEYGDKIALMGTIPSTSVFLDGSPEEVYEFAYNECMVGCKNGGFILSGDCDLPPSTPEENIRQVIKAARDAEKVLYNK